MRRDEQGCLDLYVDYTTEKLYKGERIEVVAYSFPFLFILNKFKSVEGQQNG